MKKYVMEEENVFIQSFAGMEARKEKYETFTGNETARIIKVQDGRKDIKHVGKKCTEIP